MEKDIGKIKKNEQTDIIVRIDEFGGKPGVTIREFVTSERYTGFTKSGTRIPADKFIEFRELINTIPIGELSVSSASQSSLDKGKKPKKEKEAKESSDEENAYI